MHSITTSITLTFLLSQTHSFALTAAEACVSPEGRENGEATCTVANSYSVSSIKYRVSSLLAVPSIAAGDVTNSIDLTLRFWQSQTLCD